MTRRTAEALERAVLGVTDGNGWTIRDANGRWVGRPRFVAAILAALPPDWCGHAPLEAEIARLRAALNELVKAVDVHGVCACLPDDDPDLSAALAEARKVTE